MTLWATEFNGIQKLLRAEGMNKCFLTRNKMQHIKGEMERSF